MSHRNQHRYKPETSAHPDREARRAVEGVDTTEEENHQ